MKERASAPGGCWKLQGIRLHQAGRPTMMEAYDGRQVVGMDLHRRRSVLVRMTEDGRKLETVRITSSPGRAAGSDRPGGEEPAGGHRGDVRLVLGRGRARGRGGRGAPGASAGCQGLLLPAGQERPVD